MLNTYGLTETGSTIAGERLPPVVRKPGSVGVAVGSEIAILDDSRAQLPPGQVVKVGARPQHRGLCSRRRGQPAVLHRRLVAHRRPGDSGSGRIFIPDRAHQGDYQSGR